MVVKMIRYGGIYARHRDIDKKLHWAISREKHRFYRCFNQWRTDILSAFGYDPLKCECGTTMLFLEPILTMSVFLWIRRVLKVGKRQYDLLKAYDKLRSKK